jgi:hypothetical protein
MRLTPSFGTANRSLRMPPLLGAAEYETSFVGRQASVESCIIRE